MEERFDQEETVYKRNKRIYRLDESFDREICRSENLIGLYKTDKELGRGRNQFLPEETGKVHVQVVESNMKQRNKIFSAYRKILQQQNKEQAK